MSYCVNCGVELERSIRKCPLCRTPVVNPNNLELLTSDLPPYPTSPGKVDPVKKTDTAILISVVLVSTAIACGLLNLLVFQASLWSLYIIGACALLWVLLSPFFIPYTLSAYYFVMIDGVAISLYLFLIHWRHPGNNWFWELGLPITALVSVMLLIYTFYLYHVKTSILLNSALLFLEIGVLCIGVDLLIHQYLDLKLYITWSAVVATCCLIIDIALVTVIRHKRLREEVRRRLHI